MGEGMAHRKPHDRIKSSEPHHTFYTLYIRQTMIAQKDLEILQGLGLVQAAATKS